ncbi:MAG TPA: DUF2795 domain-containing protein [Gaiellaceae bacterium]|nr:DUF2795 domain-containing protein [Gaiellaceae bacterium]
MDNAAVAELKTTLQGVALPAQKPTLLEYAVQQRAEPLLLGALRSLPDREFESLDEVVEELRHVQPRSVDEPPQPHEGSGQPPGSSDDYVTPHPADTGRVRDLDRAEE